MVLGNRLCFNLKFFKKIESSLISLALLFLIRHSLSLFLLIVFSTYAMNEQTVGLYSPLNKNQKEEEEASTSFMSTHVGRGKFPYCGVWRACGCWWLDDVACEAWCSPSPSPSPYIFSLLPVLVVTGAATKPHERWGWGWGSGWELGWAK